MLYKVLSDVINTAVWVCSQVTCPNFTVNIYIVSTYLRLSLPEFYFLPECHFPLFSVTAMRPQSAHLYRQQQTVLLQVPTRTYK